MARVLSSDRYVTSEAVLYKLMVRYLEDIGLKNVGLRFEDKISVLKREKSKRMSQNLKIYKEVDQFFDEGCQFREYSFMVVDLFNGLMINVMRLMDFPVEDIQRFKYKIQKENVELPTSIKDVINYMHTLEFEEAYRLQGEVIEGFVNAKVSKQLAALERFEKWDLEEKKLDREMRIREQNERAAERKRRRR